MKILIIRNSYIVAGAEIYYLKLQDSFRKLRLNCQLILVSNNIELIERAKKTNITTYFVDSFGEEVGTKRGILRLFFNLPNYLYRYLSIISVIKKKHDPDLLLISGKTEKYILTYFSRYFKLPIIWIEHGQVFTPTISTIALYLYKLASNYCTLIFAESHDTKHDLLINNISKDKVVYIGSGVDTDKFIKSKKYNNTFTVGFMATICWEKGVKDLIETISLTKKSTLKIKFLILGEGPQLEYLRNKIRILNLDDVVTIIGKKSNVKVYLKYINILLSPIHHPGGLSLSVMEAMSMGCVPIVTDVGGNRELISNGKTGYIYSKEYAKNATLTIVKLFNNRKLLNQISINARRKVTNEYSSRIFSQNLYTLLVNQLQINSSRVNFLQLDKQQN